MTIDLTNELARLLKFTADVATAIRMYSAYNQGGTIHEDAPTDLMWLSDCLHNFDMLAHAILAGNANNIDAACEMLLKVYERYQVESLHYTRQSKPTFDRNAARLSLRDAIAIFIDIRAKVAPHLHTA